MPIRENRMSKPKSVDFVSHDPGKGQCINRRRLCFCVPFLNVRSVRHLFFLLPQTFRQPPAQQDHHGQDHQTRPSGQTTSRVVAHFSFQCKDSGAKFRSASRDVCTCCPCHGDETPESLVSIQSGQLSSSLPAFNGTGTQSGFLQNRPVFLSGNPTNSRMDHQFSA